MKKLIMPLPILVLVIGLSAAVFGVQYLAFGSVTRSTEIYAGSCEFVAWEINNGQNEAKVTCNDQEGIVGGAIVLNAHIMSNPEAFGDCRMFEDFYVTCTIPNTEEE